MKKSSKNSITLDCSTTWKPGVLKRDISRRDEYSICEQRHWNRVRDTYHRPLSGLEIIRAQTRGEKSAVILRTIGKQITVIFSRQLIPELVPFTRPRAAFHHLSFPFSSSVQ